VGPHPLLIEPWHRSSAFASTLRRVTERSPVVLQRAAEMEEMSPNDLAAPTLREILDAAQHFGLARDEVWRTVDETLGAADWDATVGESIDEMVAALAGRILAKERQALGRRRGHEPER